MERKVFCPAGFLWVNSTGPVIILLLLMGNGQEDNKMTILLFASKGGPNIGYRKRMYQY